MGASASAISPLVAPAPELTRHYVKDTRHYIEDPSEPRNPMNRLSVSYTSDYNNLPLPPPLYRF